jgi:hypothetical protein
MRYTGTYDCPATGCGERKPDDSVAGLVGAVPAKALGRQGHRGKEA